MTMRPFYRVSAAALAVMLATSLWGLVQVGPDATVPVHWNVNGDPDGYASSLVAFAITPLIGLGVVALLAIVPRIEPRRMNLQRSAGAYRTVSISLVLLVAVIHAAVVLAALGTPVPMGLLVGAAVGLLFMVIGNVLATVRSNFLFGVRTPWTLSSDLSWDRTHRLVGRLFVVAGLLMVLLALTGQMVLVVGVIVVFVVAIPVTAVVYSYRVWSDDPDRRTLGGSS
jgi:immunity protein, SdpI family